MRKQKKPCPVVEVRDDGFILELKTLNVATRSVRIAGWDFSIKDACERFGKDKVFNAIHDAIDLFYDEIECND